MLGRLWIVIRASQLILRGDVGMQQMWDTSWTAGTFL